MKIYAGQINSCVGDIAGNTEKIIEHIKLAQKANADIAVFPELCITGYPPEDLLLETNFIASEQSALQKIIAATKNIHVILGATFSDENGLHNAAYHLHNSKSTVISGKNDLPNYGVYDERRYFICSDIAKPITIHDKKVGVIICEDSWTATKTGKYLPHKIDLLVSINASPFETNKLQQRYEIATKRAREANSNLVYVNTVGGQDGVVFDGGSFIINHQGEIKASLPQFEEAGGLLENIVPEISQQESNYKAIILGLKDYVTKNNFKKVLLGLSGGIDSALVAIIAVDTLGAENVRLVVLPTHFTSQASFDDANEICKNLKIKPEQIDIEPAFKTFITMLEKNFEGLPVNLAEENLQSRIRGVTLMAISNKHNELLLTTGNKSEIAVGYSTLYGDSCGGFNPIKDLYKTEVYSLAEWRNSRGQVIPENIFKKAPTAELRHNQTDQDSLPPYEVLDEILKLLIEGHKSVVEVVAQGFDEAVVKKNRKTIILRRIQKIPIRPRRKALDSCIWQGLAVSIDQQI